MDTNITVPGVLTMLAVIGLLAAAAGAGFIFGVVKGYLAGWKVGVNQGTWRGWRKGYVGQDLPGLLNDPSELDPMDKVR